MKIRKQRIIVLPLAFLAPWREEEMDWGHFESRMRFMGDGLLLVAGEKDGCHIS